MSSSSRILIVDDYPDNVEILENILCKDYQVATANSGEEALALAPNFRPDLILLDVMMPGIDGYDSCRQLRALKSLQHTKIVMVSAKAMASERLKGYEAGADDYITKPFDVEELRAKVRVYLRLKTLEELHQLKTDVLNLLNHETITPLNGILGLATLMQDCLDMVPEERFELLDMIRQNAIRLNTLYTKVRKLATLRNGRRNLDKSDCTLTDLNILVRQAAETMELQATAKHIELSLTCMEPTIVCMENVMMQLDTKHIQDTILALLDNAIQVTPCAGRVDVRVWQDHTQICIAVVDQGPGISPEFLPHIFTPFFQPDIDHHNVGHGLSLAVARAVVEAHNGAIDVESELDEGAKFTVRLPIIGARPSLGLSPQSTR